MLDRMAGLDVLGEDEDANVGMLAFQLDGGLQPFGGVRRRHADVDDDGVGLVGSHCGQQTGGVRELSDDVDALIGQQSGDAGTHEARIVDEHDAQRIHRRMMPYRARYRGRHHVLGHADPCAREVSHWHPCWHGRQWRL